MAAALLAVLWCGCQRGAHLTGDGESDADASGEDATAEDVADDAATDYTDEAEAGCIDGIPACLVLVDVDSGATVPDGLGWATAFRAVQDGIDAASDRLSTEPEMDDCEVWVAEGTYTAVMHAREMVTLRPGVILYGGFEGVETCREERDWKLHPTILDGGRAVHHVVMGSSDAVMDGFIITHGSALGEDELLDRYGGGMLNHDGASPVIRNCTFHDNGATVGGGVANYLHSTPIFENCWFVGNNATMGGAVDNRISVAPRFVGCTFSENRANEGGAVSSSHAFPTIENSIFVGNVAEEFGGAILCSQGTTFLTGVTMFGNESLGLSSHDPSDSISCDGNFDEPENDTLVVANSILWNEGSVEISLVYGAAASVRYSIVENGWGGAGNSTRDPLFVDPEELDFHLDLASPAIDAADGDLATPTDLEGKGRFDVAGIDDHGIGTPSFVDIGALEYVP